MVLVSKRRIFPLHQAISRLGTPLARTMIKAHILTGDNFMSKVETKHTAVTFDPVQFLMNFGETDTLSEQYEALPKKYLVRVWAGARSTITAETFDHLRLEVDLQNIDINMNIINLKTKKPSTTNLALEFPGTFQYVLRTQGTFKYTEYLGYI
ncbi:hypothetical protein DPMN_091721 [Dreissena polymorpha]|uniref:Uncharacterized protein n=1 Tax=Dreissena polymorpha TaxID=45954 RepID=A0A9D4L011_DREPO|nr:hypothetical protein DPMN_091721 [Dreissena polymorpha]